METTIQNSDPVPPSTQIKKNIAKSLYDIKQLNTLCESLKQSIASKDYANAQELITQCDKLKRDIEVSTEFCNTTAKKTDVVNKLLKIERKRRWRLKKRRLERVRSSFYRSMVAQRNNRQIDLWKAEREKMNELEVEEERKQNELYEKELEIQKMKKEKYELQKLLCSIDDLYKLRLSKLQQQGYNQTVPKDAIEEGLLKVAREEVSSFKETIVSKKKAKEWTMETQKEEDDEEYYFGMHHNINKLIEIRRAWDAYLVPRGHGSRIPTHFVEPPSREWL